MIVRVGRDAGRERATGRVFTAQSPPTGPESGEVVGTGERTGAGASLDGAAAVTGCVGLGVDLTEGAGDDDPPVPPSGYHNAGRRGVERVCMVFLCL